MFVPSLANADGLFDFQMKLAKSGSAEAQYKVGEMYETGFGVKQDQKKAMQWITKSAEQGLETADFKLLYWDIQKNGLRGDNKAKVGSLRKKANEGNPQAQYYIGRMHANGVGMKKNSDKAISWLNKAALVGVIEAEGELITVRENKQRQVQAYKAKQDKKKAELKAKKARENQKKQQQAKARADVTAKQKKAEALKKSNKQKSYQTRLAAQKSAEAKKRAAQKQALLKKQSEEGSQRKAQFESDPCSGKSARFLSTCR